MTIKSAALIGCFAWAVIGVILTIDGYTTQEGSHVASSFFHYAERTPLTP